MKNHLRILLSGLVKMTTERKRVQNNYEEDEEDSRPKKVPKTLVEKDSQKRLIIILERANLETIKVCILTND